MAPPECPKGTVCINYPFLFLCILLVGGGILVAMVLLLHNNNRKSAVVVPDPPSPPPTHEDRHQSQPQQPPPFIIPQVVPPPTQVFVGMEDLRYAKIYDPLRLPGRIDSSRLINFPTRGEAPDIQQMGVLTSEESDKVLPLYGRPTYRGSSKWQYYTSTDKFNPLKLPLRDDKKRDCTQEFGCDELSDGDHVDVPVYRNDNFTVTLYGMDSPRYIP